MYYIEKIGKGKGRESLYKDISFLTSHTPHPSLLTFKELFWGKTRERGKLKNFSQQEERRKIEELFGGGVSSRKIRQRCTGMTGWYNGDDVLWCALVVVAGLSAVGVGC